MFFKLKKIVSMAASDFSVALPNLVLASKSSHVNPTSSTICSDSRPFYKCRLKTNPGQGLQVVEIGNTVYIGWTGTTIFNGDNLYYLIASGYLNIDADAYLCKVGGVGINLGKIIDIQQICPAVQQ